MNIRRNILLIAIVSFATGGRLWAAPAVAEILRKMDAVSKMDADLTLKLAMTSTKPNQGARIVEGVYYRRDRDDAYLLIMTSPEVEKGNGYLRVGENMWMYRRNTRTFQIMSRGQSIAGTGATSEGFETRKYAVIYEAAPDKDGKEIVDEETLGDAKIPVYRFAVNAKVKDVSYPKAVYWVRKDNFLVMKRELYALSGTLMRTVYNPKYTSVNGRFVPILEIIVNEYEKGYKTVVELSGISLAKLNDAVFTKAYLEALSK